MMTISTLFKNKRSFQAKNNSNGVKNIKINGSLLPSELQREPREFALDKEQ